VGVAASFPPVREYKRGGHIPNIMYEDVRGLGEAVAKMPQASRLHNPQLRPIIFRAIQDDN
jgi:hypothetical protein